MFGFFGSGKDKPKTSSGTKRKTARSGQSDAAKKRTDKRAAAKVSRAKKERDAGAARKKAWAKKDADRLKKGAETKQRIADREAARKKKLAATAAVTAKKKPSSQGRNTQKTESASGASATYKNTNRQAQASSPETGSVKTKAGNYPVYKKKSAAATSFRTAFADAKKSGMKEFTWEGKRYNTKTK
tara:strand:+ start:229 stop:786 length:558 start_codon:yes stop_codon:yes gene_type:complete